MNTKNKYIPLFFISIIMIYSLLNNYNARFIDSVYIHNLYKQILFYVLGFFIIYLFSKVRKSKIFKFHYVYYFISLAFLVLVLFFGKEVNGAKAWFNFSFLSFQPSELMKFSLAISLTKITNDYNKSFEKNDIVYILKITLLTLIPSVLVFIEPDTGAIIFYFLIFLTAFFFAKINKIWYGLFLTIFISFFSVFIYMYFYNNNLLISIFGTSLFYRIDRLINFSDNYQINNAMTLMGSTSFFGVESAKMIIPESPTDFMYAYNFSNYGLFGTLVVTISYLFLCLSTLFYTAKKKDLFKSIFISVLYFGIFYNILMNLGVVPIMGIALPFLSYGGSSLLIYFLFLGVYFKD